MRQWRLVGTMVYCSVTGLKIVFIFVSPQPVVQFRCFLLLCLSGVASLASIHDLESANQTTPYLSLISNSCSQSKTKYADTTLTLPPSAIKGFSSKLNTSSGASLGRERSRIPTSMMMMIMMINSPDSTI